MTRGSGIVLAVLLAFLPARAGAQPAPAPYKAVFWYELDRPTTTVRHQVYDVRKGQFDAAAVGRWLDSVEAKHPGYAAYIRDLSTEREPGATEAERLASALAREARRWEELNRRPAARFVPIPFPSAPIGRPDAGRRDSAGPDFHHPPGAPGPISNPPGSPFPYPYRPRPI